jgi:hypothetical protein
MNAPRNVTRLPVVIEGEVYERPRTRGDCLPGGINAARPCPWVSCKYHLATDVNSWTGAVQINTDPTEMEHSCSLDVAEHGLDRSGRTLDGYQTETGLTAIADLLGVSRERVRQIEAKAMRRLVEPMRELLEEPDRTVRRIRNAGSGAKTCPKCGARPQAQVHPDTPPDERGWCRMCRRKAQYRRRDQRKTTMRRTET